MLNFGNKEFRNLQEQVLKNAQDIETLKGRENLQIVIVNELPEVGNPNYIYLVAKDDGESPDVYDEYIWLEDEERYEKIGGVSIDLTNYVTLDSEQIISGKKLFTNNLVLYQPSNTATPQLIFQRGTDTDVYDDWQISDDGGDIYIKQNNGSKLIISASVIKPYTNSYYDLGTANLRWKDLYLSDAIYFKNAASTKYFQFQADGSNNLVFKFGQDGTTYTNIAWFSNDGTHYTRSLIPQSNNYYNLGSSSTYWKDLYLTGNISDGANTVSVANIASKATSTFISGTFDSNGEFTIDTEQAGTPEGLFIFTYGNCQCFLRLTAAMVQNADTVPIRISCPMIYNGATSLGWLNITKAGYILVITITDGTNHVDSGYAWTLTKTNLL